MTWWNFTYDMCYDKVMVLTVRGCLCWARSRDGSGHAHGFDYSCVDNVLDVTTHFLTSSTACLFPGSGTCSVCGTHVPRCLISRPLPCFRANFVSGMAMLPISVVVIFHHHVSVIVLDAVLCCAVVLGG